MYKIIIGDTVHYVDSVNYVRLNENNGCYVPCKKKNAGGVCVKIPKVIENESGSIITGEDTIFAIKEGGLRGTEELCKIETAKIALEFFAAKRAEELLALIEGAL